MAQLLMIQVPNTNIMARYPPLTQGPLLVALVVPCFIFLVVDLEESPSLSPVTIPGSVVSVGSSSVLAESNEKCVEEPLRAYE